MNWIVLCFSFSLAQSAHMPMIDALMMAYTVEMISIEKVVASVKRFSTFSASKELPFDLEDAMVFWINKVWTHKHTHSKDVSGADAIKKHKTTYLTLPSAFHTSCTKSSLSLNVLSIIIQGCHSETCGRNKLFSRWHHQWQCPTCLLETEYHLCSEKGQQIGVWIWCTHKRLRLMLHSSFNELKAWGSESHDAVCPLIAMMFHTITVWEKETSVCTSQFLFLSGGIKDCYFE